MTRQRYRAGFAFLALLVTLPAFSQTQFVRTLGGTGDDYGFSLIQTADGGYAIAGNTGSFGAGSRDVLISKFDATWDHEWTRTLGGVDADRAYTLIQTADDGYAIAGYTESFGIGLNDLLLTKFDADWDHEWTRTLGGLENDYGQPLIQAADGGYVIAGYTESYGAGNLDVLIAKFDGAGNHQWTRTLGGVDNDYCISLIETSDGGYVTVGYTESFGAGLCDVLFAKFDASGDYQWTWTLGGTNDDYGHCIVETADGGYAIAGLTRSFGAGADDILLSKFDDSWTYEWSKSLGGGNWESALSLVQTADGGLVVAGFTSSYDAGSDDLLLAKFDGSWDHEWTHALGGADWESARSLIEIPETSGGGYAIVGITASFGAGFDDAILARYDASGSSCMGLSVVPVVDDSALTVETHTPEVDTIFPYITEPDPAVMGVEPEIADICVTTDFIRGDGDADMDVEMSDAIFTLKALYVPGAPQPSCMDASDSDDNGAMEMSDAIYTLKYLYVPGSPPPPAPGPDTCGYDPTEDGLDCVSHPCLGAR